MRVISFFTFGVLLILIGAIGSFFDWSQSMLFIGMGLTAELLALAVYALNKIRKK